MNLVVSKLALLGLLVATPPPATPAARASASAGRREIRLSLDSIPSGATVLLDGEPLTDADGRLARTPLVDLRFEVAGPFKLTLVRQGYWPHAQTFTPETFARPAQPLRIALRPEPEAGSPPAPPPEPRPAAPGGLPGCQRLSGFGYITVSSDPPSEVYLDDELLGLTPISKARVPAGCLHLRAVDPEGKREKLIKVQVEPNKVVRFAIKL